MIEMCITIAPEEWLPTISATRLKECPQLIDMRLPGRWINDSRKSSPNCIFCLGRGHLSHVSCVLLTSRRHQGCVTIARAIWCIRC